MMSWWQRLPATVRCSELSTRRTTIWQDSTDAAEKSPALSKAEPASRACVARDAAALPAKVDCGPLGAGVRAGLDARRARAGGIRDQQRTRQPSLDARREHRRCVLPLRRRRVVLPDVVANLVALLDR